MSDNWTATVQRINPATDALIVKCQGQISQEQAHDIKKQIEATFPGVKVLIFDQGFETVIIKRRRAKTLVRAARRA